MMLLYSNKSEPLVPCQETHLAAITPYQIQYKNRIAGIVGAQKRQKRIQCSVSLHLKKSIPITSVFVYVISLSFFCFFLCLYFWFFNSSQLKQHDSIYRKSAETDHNFRVCQKLALPAYVNFLLQMNRLGKTFQSEYCTTLFVRRCRGVQRANKFRNK